MADSEYQFNTTRIARWMWTALFAWAPVGLTAIVLSFAGELRYGQFEDQPATIFASLILSASAWRDLSAPDVPINDFPLQIAVISTGVITVVSAGVYMLYIAIVTFDLQRTFSLSSILNFSVILALVTMAGGTILQFLIARGEHTVHGS